MSKKKLQLASEEVEYDIVRSSRRTVALYVRPGGAILVRAPWYVPVYVIKHFVEEKAPWIIRQRKKLKDVKPAIIEQHYTEGCSIRFMGETLILRIRESERKSILLIDKELVISLPKANSDERVKALIEGWYLTEAKRHFLVRTHELATLHANLLPQPRSVNVRKMKSRWGTCKSDGTIWFNRELIKKDSNLIDSVIIHELCHLVHHNHGSEFYRLLENIIPDYRLKRKELRQCL